LGLEYHRFSIGEMLWNGFTRSMPPPRIPAKFTDAYYHNSIRPKFLFITHYTEFSECCRVLV
jgi:hypothetical protein